MGDGKKIEQEETKWNGTRCTLHPISIHGEHNARPFLLHKHAFIPQGTGQDEQRKKGKKCRFVDPSVSPPAHLLPLLRHDVPRGDGRRPGRVGDGVEDDVAGAAPPRSPLLLRALAVRDGALDGALLGPGAGAPLQRRRRRGGPEGEPVAARRRRGRAQRRDARRRGLCGGHEARPTDDAGEGLAVVAGLVVLVRRGRPRAVDGDVAGPGRGEEEGPDVVPGRPPLHHLEPLGPRRLLTARRLGLGSAVSRRRRVPLDPASLLLQPRRQVEREEVAPVEEFVRRRRERRRLLLLPLPAPAASSALELEARRGGRLRRGRRCQVHVAVVVVLDHHCGRPRRRCCHGNAGFCFGLVGGEGERNEGGLYCRVLG
jgi:hypothetical protein